MNLNTSKIVDIEVEGVDRKDYPDFCDAYISKAGYPIVENPRFGIKEGYRDLTEDELEYLNDKCRDWVYEKIMDWIF